MPKLSGQKEILAYIGMDWRTILSEGFPVARIGGRWWSHTDSIDEFVRDRVEAATNERGNSERHSNSHRRQK